MDSSNRATGEQALTNDQSGIRFAEDRPIKITCLEDAIIIFHKTSDDPYVFQALIFFLSTLLSTQLMHDQLHELQILHMWNIRRQDMTNSYRFVYRDIETCTKVLDIIEQLDPNATCRVLGGMAAAHLQGFPSSGNNHVNEGYTIVNRGHDWIVRCAWESDIDDRYKEWLRLMYEKQPCKMVDVPSGLVDEGKFTYIETLWTAAQSDGFEVMIPVIKFWLRQALTMVNIWHCCFQTRVEGVETPLPYEWCVASYDKMWYQFKKELQNPFSDYPYKVREQLQKMSYMRVFEECWKWVKLAAQSKEDFEMHEVRKLVYNHMLVMARNEFEPHEQSTMRVLKKSFGDHQIYGEYNILGEEPVVYLHNLNDYPHLREIQSLHDGLCKEFYPNLPDISQEEYDVRYPVSEQEIGSESVSEMDLDDADLQSGGIQDEAYGPRIDISQFTFDKPSDENDYCAICQTDITLGGSYEQRCIVTVDCLHVFHAECLDEWVNGAMENSNTCPQCRALITSQRRPRREME